MFSWLQQLGDVDPEKMARVFNRGIGLVLVVSTHFADSIQAQLAAFGTESWVIGAVCEAAD